jgi:hypothetical protein
MAITIKNPKNKILNAEEDQSTICLPDHDAKIAKLAYYKAEKRKFELGYELEDWLEAEKEYLL